MIGIYVKPIPIPNKIKANETKIRFTENMNIIWDIKRKTREIIQGIYIPSFEETMTPKGKADV